MPAELPIDLRSDTVTRPTPAMRAAMNAAAVGDDVFGEDPTINRLEEVVAARLGKEAAVYVPSGTMSNQIAVKIHTRPGDELLCDQNWHLYCARLWNAVVATGIAAHEWAQHFDTVSVCFSKGLGAPVGSALAGPRELIQRARRARKLFGGGMRQAGVLAAAALHALDHHVDRLADDHRNARVLGQAVAETPGLRLDPPDVHTNIVWVEVEPDVGTAKQVADALKERG